MLPQGDGLLQLLPQVQGVHKHRCNHKKTQGACFQALDLCLLRSTVWAAGDWLSHLIGLDTTRMKSCCTISRDTEMMTTLQEGHMLDPPVSYSELKTAFLAAFSSAWRWRTSSAAASWMACRG